MVGVKKRKVLYMIGVILFIITPFLSVALFCLKDGKMFWDVYLPLGGWSDEITYYKQIEGILSYGMPRGYFGYNQSRALYGTLGVWGLQPLLPYCLWGGVLGWDYVSPIYANIFFCVVSLAIVYLLLRPNRRQMGLFSLFWFLNPFINRYLLSGAIEASVTAQLLLVTAMGLALLSNRNRRTRIPDTALMAMCTLLICYMALGRPYYEVLFLIPFWKACKDRKRVWQVLLPVLALMILGLFFLNNHFFCSTYFSSAVSFSRMFDRGLWGIIIYLFSSFWEMAHLMWYAVRYNGVGAGWYYLLLAVELLAMAVVCIYRRICHRAVPVMFLITFLGNILILISLIELYDIGVGARHILALIMANAFLLAMETRLPVNGVLSLLCLLAFVRIGNADAPPYQNDEYVRYMEQLREEFARVVSVTEQVSYENVVAMPTADSSALVPGEPVSTYYGLLFALPAGVGISLDYEDFYDNLENVRAGYIMVHPEGLIRRKLEEAGMTCVFENQELALYARPFP